MYDASPPLAHVPLDSQAVETLLLTSGQELATTKNVRHLLSRFRATLTEQLNTQRGLERQLDEVRAARQSASDPVANAFSVLGALDEQQLAAVFDIQAQALLAKVAEARQEATLARAAAASETNRARLTLAEVAQSPGISAEGLAALRAAMERVPSMRLPEPSAPVTAAGGFALHG